MQKLRVETRCGGGLMEKIQIKLFIETNYNNSIIGNHWFPGITKLFPCQFRQNEIELCQDENQDRVNEFQFRSREEIFVNMKLNFAKKKMTFAYRLFV